MITILHGENTVESRQKMETLKSPKDKEVIVLEGGKVSLNELTQALEAKSLFGQARLVILENFFFGRKKNKGEKEILAYLQALPDQTDLIFWESQNLNSSVLRLFPKAQILPFKLDPLLFRFLESLKPGESRQMVESFRKVLFQDDVNLVFYMLVRQFRLLLFLKSGKGRGLEELDRLAQWQKSKLLKQAQVFSLEKLLESYHELLEIDWREKTGKSAYSLPQTLELFFANL